MIGTNDLAAHIKRARERACSVDKLANTIRVVDGNHLFGAGALADAIADAGALVNIFNAGMEARNPEVYDIKDALSTCRRQSEENLARAIEAERALAEALKR